MGILNKDPQPAKAETPSTNTGNSQMEIKPPFDPAQFGMFSNAEIHIDQSTQMAKVVIKMANNVTFTGDIPVPMLAQTGLDNFFGKLLAEAGKQKVS